MQIVAQGDANRHIHVCTREGSNILQFVKKSPTSAFILPKKPIAHLKNILANFSDTVHVDYSDETHHIRFSFGNFELYSSLKEGKYPNYESVIPKENPNVLTIGRDEFLNPSAVWATIPANPPSKSVSLCRRPVSI